jgi:tetratricopeptide (TPR) repeat protein
LGKIDNAYNCFIKAFDHDPNNHRAKAMIGDMLLELGDVKRDISEMLNYYTKAKNIYIETIKMSKEPDDYNRLGVAYTKIAFCIDEIDGSIASFKEANKQFDDAITRRTDYAEAYYNLGKNFYALGEKMSLKAAHSDENIDEYLNDRKKHLKSAKEAFSKATDYRDDYFEAYYYLALTLSKIEGADLGTVHAMTKKAVNGLPDNPEANSLHGNYLARMASNASPERRKKCLIQACSHFASATTYKKSFKEAYFAWGAALTILQKQSELAEDEIEAKLESRDAFYKLEQAIALFFDYPDFYFNPDEIDEIVDTYNFIITLETMFTGDETYNDIKNYAEIRDKGDVKLESQFENWLNEEELSTLEFSDFYRNLVLKAVFRDFMTTDEKESLKDLSHVPIENLVSLIETITSREEITDMIDGEKTIVPSWKDRKATK